MKRTELTSSRLFPFGKTKKVAPFIIISYTKTAHTTYPPQLHTKKLREPNQILKHAAHTWNTLEEPTQPLTNIDGFRIAVFYT